MRWFSQWKCMSETCWKQQKTKVEEEAFTASNIKLILTVKHQLFCQNFWSRGNVVLHSVVTNYRGLHHTGQWHTWTSGRHDRRYMQRLLMSYQMLAIEACRVIKEPIKWSQFSASSSALLCPDSFGQNLKTHYF